MPTSSKVIITDTDNSSQVQGAKMGLAALEGVTRRGPANRPDIIITNLKLFRKIYGGVISTSDFPFQAERILKAGGSLRINAIRHYSDITDPETLTAVKASLAQSIKAISSIALVTPTGLAAAGFTTGGVLAAGIFRIKAVAVDNLGNTTLPTAAEIAVTLTGTTSRIEASCNPSPGAAGYRFYITDVNGSTGAENKYLQSVGPSVIITDLSALVSAALPNTNNTAGIQTSIFGATSKYEGDDYNNLRLVISNATNAKANYFNLQLFILGDEENTNEPYENLQVTLTDIPNSHYLDEVNQNSELAQFSYLDLSALSVAKRPINGTYNFSGGSNGDATVPTDYIGDTAAKTGLFAFDAFDDISDIAIPVITDAEVNQALGLYAEGRKDLQALIHLDNSLVTAQQYVTARGVLDSKYVGFFGGGIVKIDPNTKQANEFSEIADIININNFVDKNFFPWTSRANFQKGLIPDASGVVNNFGSPGSENDLELLANNQINMVINANGKVYLKGNFSGQIEASKASYFAIMRGLIYVKKSLKPTLEKYLEEPADIPTFSKLFLEVEPFLDSLTTNRFLYKGAGVSGKGYDWNGDQDATDINSLQFNTIDDLDKGIYNIELALYPINSIQVIKMNISLNSTTSTASISFTN